MRDRDTEIKRQEERNDKKTRRKRDRAETVTVGQKEKSKKVENTERRIARLSDKQKERKMVR